MMESEPSQVHGPHPTLRRASPTPRSADVTAISTGLIRLKPGARPSQALMLRTLGFQCPPPECESIAAPSLLNRN